jgi:heme-degrading monooxygenase HmoA
MILEVATLDVRSGQEADFDRAFAQAALIISSMKGYLSHELQRCIERPNRYVLLVRWQTLEDHTVRITNRKGTADGTAFDWQHRPQSERRRPGL